MKKLSLKLSTLLLALSMAIIILVSVSCKSVESVPQITRMETDKHESHVLQRVDTIYRHDSVFVSERQRGDTVYLTRTEWRDRWRTRVERDTVVDVRVEKEVVQLPPERYVPKFHKWCTGILLTILVVAIGRLMRKIFLP